MKWIDIFIRILQMSFAICQVSKSIIFIEFEIKFCPVWGKTKVTSTKEKKKITISIAGRKIFFFIAPYQLTMPLQRMHLIKETQ